MPRLQDMLFAALAVVVIGMLAFGIQVGVFALLGAFACGALYALAGMVPSSTEGFWRRVFTTVFLSVVVSSIVLIVPGTLGARVNRPDIQKTVIEIAGLLPVLAILFEVLRTPRVIQTILHYFRPR